MFKASKILDYFELHNVGNQLSNIIEENITKLRENCGFCLNSKTKFV